MFKKITKMFLVFLNAGCNELQSSFEQNICQVIPQLITGYLHLTFHCTLPFSLPDLRFNPTRPYIYANQRLHSGRQLTNEGT